MSLSYGIMLENKLDPVKIPIDFRSTDEILVVMPLTEKIIPYSIHRASVKISNPINLKFQYIPNLFR